MGTFFIFITMLFFGIVISVLLQNIQIELEHKNKIKMNINTEEGTKVKYTGTGGYDIHKEHANKYLKVGETYTVLKTNVSGWHTDVFLKEVPNQCFNSVHFEELT